MRIIVAILSICSLTLTACTPAARLDKNNEPQSPSIAEYISAHARVWDTRTRKWSFRRANQSINGRIFKEGRVLRVELPGSNDARIVMWYTPCMEFETVKQSLRAYGFATDTRPLESSHEGPTTRYIVEKRSPGQMERVTIELDPTRKTTCVSSIYL